MVTPDRQENKSSEQSKISFISNRHTLETSVKGAVERVSDENIIIPDGISKQSNLKADNKRILRSHGVLSEAEDVGKSNFRCHYCRTKCRMVKYLSCKNLYNCRRSFCFNCLRKYFFTNPLNVFDKWSCLVCTKRCVCTRCQVSNKEKLSKKELTQNKLKPKNKVKDYNGFEEITSLKTGKRKMQTESDSESGSLYTPSVEKPKKKSEYAVRTKPAEFRRRKIKSSKEQEIPKPTNNKHKDEKKVTLPPISQEGKMILESDPSKYLMEQSYQRPSGGDNQMQHISYQYPYFLPGISQPYNRLLNQHMYMPMNYFLYPRRIDPNYPLNQGINHNFSEGYSKGNLNYYRHDTIINY